MWYDIITPFLFRELSDHSVKIAQYGSPKKVEPLTMAATMLLHDSSALDLIVLF